MRLYQYAALLMSSCLVATPSEHLAITLAILGRDPIHLHEIILAHLRGNSYFDAGP